jgi:hypothetical protein
MVRYSFVLHEVVDSPRFLQSQHHFGYKLLLYSSYGSNPRCIAKLASVHFVSGQGWCTRINVSKFCYYVVRGASFSSKSHHGFPIFFLNLLCELITQARSNFFSGVRRGMGRFGRVSRSRIRGTWHFQQRKEECARLPFFKSRFSYYFSKVR